MHLQHALKPSRSKSKLVRSRRKKRSAGGGRLRQKPNKRKQDSLLNVPKSRLPKPGSENYRDSWRLLIMRLRVTRRALMKLRLKLQRLRKEAKNPKRVERLSVRRSHPPLLRFRLQCRRFLHPLYIRACQSQALSLRPGILSSSDSVHRQASLPKLQLLRPLRNHTTPSTASRLPKNPQRPSPRLPLHPLAHVHLVLAQMMTTGPWSTLIKRMNLLTRKALELEVPVTSPLSSLEPWALLGICLVLALPLLLLLQQAALHPLLLHHLCQVPELHPHPQCRTLQRRLRLQCQAPGRHLLRPCQGWTVHHHRHLLPQCLLLSRQVERVDPLGSLQKSSSRSS